MPPRDRRGPAAVAGAAFALVAALTYALARVVERAAFAQPNPAGIVWSERSAFAWRAIIALYAGGAAAFGAHALARRSPSTAARALLIAAASAVVVAGVQAALWP